MKHTTKIGELIRENVQATIFDHLIFTDVLKQIDRCVQDTLRGFNPCFEMLIGPSRCGKSEVLEAIARKYPPQSENGRRSIPVLLVDVPSGGGAKALDKAVIRATGVPVPESMKNEDSLKQFMLKQLRLANVRVIIFDEANHLVERGARIVSAAASDWFKVLYKNAANVGIVLAGVPRLARLIEDNPQLRNRVGKPILFSPYRYDDQHHRKAFANCVAAYISEFEEHGCTFAMPFDNMVRHCYVTTAGQVGLLAAFFAALAKITPAPCEITRELCKEASMSRNLPGSGKVKPFRHDKIYDHQLMEVLSSELVEYDMILGDVSRGENSIYLAHLHKTEDLA